MVVPSRSSGATCASVCVVRERYLVVLEGVVGSYYPSGTSCCSRMRWRARVLVDLEVYVRAPEIQKLSFTNLPDLSLNARSICERSTEVLQSSFCAAVDDFEL